MKEKLDRDRSDAYPLVSVVVLTYRKFDNLFKALSSVINQTYPKIELIVQDDGSDAFPADRIREFLSGRDRFSNIIVSQNEKNLGTVRNYNRAVQLSCGEIVIPLAQDDAFSDENAVSVIVRRFQETGCALCTAKRRGAVSGRILPSRANVELLKAADKKALLLIMMFNPSISGSVLYFRKAEFCTENSPVFDERFRLLEDWPFLLDCIEKDIRIEFIDQVLVEYGEAGVSNGQTLSPLFLSDVIFLYENVILPRSRDLFGKDIQLILAYKHCRYLDRYDRALSGRKTSRHSRKLLMRHARLGVLLLGMKAYEKRKKTEIDANRKEYLLKIENKR